MDLEQREFGVEHVQNGIYTWWIKGDRRYGPSEKLPDWAKLLMNMRRQDMRLENRDRRLKRMAAAKGTGAVAESFRRSAPNSMLDHSDRICLKYLESVQAGASCVQAKQGTHSRCAVNCYTVQDWERHEREALR